MRFDRLAVLLVSATLLGCSGPEPSACDDCELAMKCTFAASDALIQRDEAFAYVARSSDGRYHVAHAIAIADEALDSKGLEAQGDLAFWTARTEGLWLRWRMPGAQDEYSLSRWEGKAVGERFLAFAVSDLSPDAYPPCFVHRAWEPPPDD